MSLSQTISRADINWAHFFRKTSTLKIIASKTNDKNDFKKSEFCKSLITQCPYIIWFGCVARNSDFELALIFGSHMLNIGNIQTQNALLILLFLELNYEMVYFSITIIKIFFWFVLLEFSLNIQINKPCK